MFFRERWRECVEIYDQQSELWGSDRPLLLGIAVDRGWPMPRPIACHREMIVLSGGLEGSASLFT